MNIVEPNAVHKIYGGVIEGATVQTATKKFNEVSNLYQNNAIDDNPTVYNVYSYSQGDANIAGNLNWGLTVMKPICIHEECNMTKGHFHENRNCAEIYFGIAGEGLLMLMDEEGNTWAEKIYQGSLHHIDGHLAHRLINIGDSDLKVGACWPTTAGHDYEAVTTREFAYRVFKRNGKIEIEERQ